MLSSLLSHSKYRLRLSLLSLLLIWQGVLCTGEVHHINTAEGFIDFSSKVNNGESFSGTTVFLDADIDFSGGLSEEFKPVGTSTSKSFPGTFDGQGHTISNLALN